MRSLFSMILLTAFVAFSGFGCLEDIEEVPLDRDGDALEAPAGVSAGVGEGSILLSWSPVDGASSYNVYRRASSVSVSELAGNTSSTSYLDDGLVNGREYMFAVAALDSRGLEGRRTEEIAAVPSVYSIRIGDGSGVANSGTVDITITAPSTTVLMKISDIYEMSAVPWEFFSGTREWDIGSGDGVKTVYAQFQDQNGSSSGVISEDVVLDTYAEIGSVSISPDLAKYALGATVRLSITTAGFEKNGTAWIEIEEMSDAIELFDNGLGGDQVAGNGVYERSYSFPLSFRGTELGVAGTFVDRAGNRSPSKEAQRKISFTDTPEPVRLIGAIDSTTSSITIKWVESAETDFLAYRIYRSRTPGVTESPENFVRGLDNRSQTSYPDGSLIEGATYYYRIFVVNDLYDTAGSNEVAARTYDAYPSAVTLDSPSAVGTDRLTLTWSVNDDTDFEEYRIYRSTTPGVTTSSERLPYISDREITWFDDTGLDLAGTTYYYRVMVFDKSGKNTRSNEVSTD